jgi:predicted Zn-dependent protease
MAWKTKCPFLKKETNAKTVEEIKSSLKFFYKFLHSILNKFSLLYCIKNIKMKRIFIATSIAIITIASCAKNGITGRRSFKLFSNEQIASMAASEYQSFLSSNKVVTDVSNKDAEMVRRVGSRIATAVTNFYKNDPKISAELATYKWEYNLVDSKDVNAWCMPGGKIVVYTGLLGVTQDEPSLAAVMGHEIVHALANHGNTRMSNQMVAQLGGVALDVALATKKEETRNLFGQAFGIGSSLGILSFSRKDELESDRYGIRFAAMAGYNPEAAIGLWQRMAAASAGAQKPPEFLSTHPVEERRIAELQKHMPEALSYYRPVSK